MHKNRALILHIVLYLTLIVKANSAVATCVFDTAFGHSVVFTATGAKCSGLRCGVILISLSIIS